MKPEQRMQGIRIILSDVDGVMTAGGITYDNQGVESKTFHVRVGWESNFGNDPDTSSGSLLPEAPILLNSEWMN